MISIRAHLLWILLPAFSAISIAAGLGVYYSTKAELEARLDARLAGHAVELRFARRAPEPERERDTNRPRLFDSSRGEFRDRTRLTRGTGAPGWLQGNLFTNLSSTVYCEINLKSGSLKSPNLKEQAITRPARFPDDPIFYDTELTDGSPLRAWASRLAVNRPGREPEVILAIDRSGVDGTLERLARNLVGGGIAICLFLSLLLMLSLRASLKPLRQLGEQAVHMGAESLHERFAEESAPSDIRPIVQRLNHLMERLEESFARERRFSGDLAHELRTPLAAIRATSEVALKWPEQATEEDHEEIFRLASGLQQTLDSLLMLARMEASAAEQSAEPTHPAKLAEECAALHADRARERGLSIETSLEREKVIETDPRMLRIIMTNLIGNAVEYAPAGSSLLVAAGAGKLVFQCVNDAPNLAEEDVAHLFERMWRKDAARTESGHAGLGLSIAKACATALGLDLSATLDDEGRLRITLHS